jgi:hypothetical protein
MFLFLWNKILPIFSKKTFYIGNKLINYLAYFMTVPPLWFSGQSSWLHIRRPGFDTRHYENKKEIVGLERGPLSLVSTTEELLDRKVAALV